MLRLRVFSSTYIVNDGTCPLYSRSWCRKLLILAIHRDAPVDNHAVSQHEEQRRGLRDGNMLLNVSVEQEPDSQQAEQNVNKAFRFLHEDLAIDLLEFGASNQWIGEDEPAYQKGNSRPPYRDAYLRLNEHQKPGAHRDGRDDDLLDGDGAVARFHPNENNGQCHNQHRNRRAYLKNWGIEINHNSEPLSINKMT